MSNTSFSMAKLELLADTNADMPLDGRLDPGPVLGHGKIPAEPQFKARARTKVGGGTHAQHLASAIRFSKSGEPVVPLVVPIEFRANPPLLSHRVGLIRTVGKVQAAVKAISQLGALRPLGSTQVVDGSVRHELFHVKESGVGAAEVRKQVHGPGAGL